MCFAAHAVVLLVPLGAYATPRSRAARVCSMTSGGHLEGLLGVEAEHLLGGGDLLGAEGAPWRLGVLRVGAGQAMIVSEDDERAGR